MFFSLMAYLFLALIYNEIHSHNESVSLFGISDWISFHGVSNLYNWDRIHMDQNPYDFQKYDALNRSDFIMASADI